jgi:hypothetical protein
MMAKLTGRNFPIVTSEDIHKAEEKYLKKSGRPTKYNQHIAAEIVARLKQGETLTHICKDVTMPAIASVYNWEGQSPAFLEEVIRARKHQAGSLADESKDALADATAKDMPTVRLAEGRARHYLELARVFDPSRFGNQVRVNHDVVIETMADRIRRLTGGSVVIPAEFSHIVDDTGS